MRPDGMGWDGMGWDGIGAYVDTYYLALLPLLTVSTDYYAPC